MGAILNKRVATPEEQANAIYVGRPSKWGNPYTHVRSRTLQARYRVATRDDAVDGFIIWVMQPYQKWLRDAARVELRGRDLLCWCAPLRCHAQVWQIIAESLSDADLSWESFGFSPQRAHWLESTHV